jgi:hypothetical protein
MNAIDRLANPAGLGPFAAQPTSTRRVRVSSAACLCLAPTANKPSLSIQLPRADQVAVSCPPRPPPLPPTPPTSGFLCISFSPSVSCTLPLFPALTPDHCSTVLLLANKAGLLHPLSKSIHYSTHPRAGMTSEEAATGAARVSPGAKSSACTPRMRQTHVVRRWV